MDFIATHFLQLLAAASTGLLAGALLAEDRLLLPYWRTLPAATFYELHPTYGPLLYRFFAPLTAVAPATSVLAAAFMSFRYGWFGAPAIAAIGAALLTVSLLGFYSFYFKDANEAFARKAISAERLPAELARWAAWHRARLLVCLAAFFLSLVSLAL